MMNPKMNWRLLRLPSLTLQMGWAVVESRMDQTQEAAMVAWEVVVILAPALVDAPLLPLPIAPKHVVARLLPRSAGGVYGGNISIFGRDHFVMTVTYH